MVTATARRCSPPWGGRGCPSGDFRSFRRLWYSPFAVFIKSADGTAQRESFRRFLHTTLQPLTRVVEAELSEKLEGEVTLNLDATFASDLSGRSRAFQSLVNGGMAVEKAAGLAGLMEAD